MKLNCLDYWFVTLFWLLISSLFRALVEKYDSGFDFPDTGAGGGPIPTDPCYTDVLHRMQSEEAAEIDNLRRLPTSSDFLIAYATVPGKS